MPTRERHNIAENYIDVAKVNSYLQVDFMFKLSCSQTLLNSVSHIPSLDTLQAIMLLCWFEHHHHRLPGKLISSPKIWPSSMVLLHRFPYLLRDGK